MPLMEQFHTSYHSLTGSDISLKLHALGNILLLNVYVYLQVLLHSAPRKLPAGWIKMPLAMEVLLDSGHIVLDGDPAPFPQKGAQSPIFGPWLWCPKGRMNQDATWMEVGLDPSEHCVRWRPSSPLPKKGAEPPIFGPRLLWPNGWMDQGAIWYEGLGPGRIVLHGDPTPSLKMGTAPNFRPVSIVAKRSPISATGEQFF